MGLEYRIRLQEVEPNRVGEILRAAPFFSEFEHGFFNFRHPNADSSEWPAVFAKIETEGIYICDNCDRVVFQALVQYLRQNLNVAEQDFCIEEL